MYMRNCRRIFSFNTVKTVYRWDCIVLIFCCFFSLIYKHQEQQEAIDSIENNIDNAQVNVHEGTRQLGKVRFRIMLLKASSVKCQSVACIDSLDQHRD